MGVKSTREIRVLGSLKRLPHRPHWRNIGRPASDAIVWRVLVRCCATILPAPAPYTAAIARSRPVTERSKRGTPHDEPPSELIQLDSEITSIPAHAEFAATPEELRQKKLVRWM